MVTARNSVYLLWVPAHTESSYWWTRIFEEFTPLHDPVDNNVDALG